MKVIRIQDFTGGSDFAGSRFDAEKIREIIYAESQKDSYVTLDFVHIELMTQGFADELIGIFIRSFGREFVKNHIKVVNHNTEIKNMLNFVASYNDEPVQKGA